MKILPATTITDARLWIIYIHSVDVRMCVCIYYKFRKAFTRRCQTVKTKISTSSRVRLLFFYVRICEERDLVRHTFTRTHATESHLRMPANRCITVYTRIYICTILCEVGTPFIKCGELNLTKS